MTWQTETTAATDSYRDLLISMVAMATSQHVSVAAVNAGGTGYVVGDVLTITHAGAYHDLRLEVTAVSAGVITAVLIISGGAFSNRVATVAVNAGGTGYSVGEILEIQNGTSTEKAKASVTTESAGVITGVALFETGGAYTVAPSLTAEVTLGVGPSTFAGNDDATLDLTMTGLIGTTAIAATGGTGSGATFDLTLTATGWASQKNTNDRLINSIDFEKEVILLGTVAGGDAPYVGFLSYTQGSGASTRRGIAMYGMTAFNSALPLASQPGIGPIPGTLGSSSGSHVLVHEAAREWWLGVTPRKIAGVVRTTDITICYVSFYVGLMNGFGTATTSPYPMFVGASSNVAQREVDNIEQTGLSECYQSPSGSGPMHFRRKSDGAWVTVRNGFLNVATPTQDDNNTMFPVCSLQEVNVATVPEQRHATDGPAMLETGAWGSNIRANATDRVFPAPDSGDDVFVPIPLTVLATNGTTVNDINLEVAGELDDVFWFGGTTSAGATVSPEDFMDAGGVRYRIFPNGTQGVSAKPYQFFMMAER